MDYWKTKLANLPELKLPSDFDRKDGHGCCQGGWVDIAIPEHIILALQDFAPKLDATLYMLLLSSLKLLLAARSCKNDIVVSQLCLLQHSPQDWENVALRQCYFWDVSSGVSSLAEVPLQITAEPLTQMNASCRRLCISSIMCMLQVASPFVGRADSEMSNLVGCCINTLVMRTNIKGRETLGDLVTAVKETATSAFRHAEAPMHTVMQALGRTSDNPLFSVSPLPPPPPQDSSAI